MADQNEHRGGTGNVANDPKRASELGKKSGESSLGRQHEQGTDTDKRQQGSQGSDSNRGADPKSGQR